MSHARDLLRTTPAAVGFDPDALAECIDTCLAGDQACSACADACLGEPAVADLVRCVRLCLDCADVCAAAGRVLSRQTAYDAELTRGQLVACARACEICAAECEGHADIHRHCAVCAEACRRCQAACEALLEAA